MSKTTYKVTKESYGYLLQCYINGYLKKQTTFTTYERADEAGKRWVQEQEKELA